MVNAARWQRALITGASSGIGEAFARRLASHCDAMTLVARRRERLRALADELGGACTVEILPVDLLAGEGVAAVVEHIRQRTPVDLLINNAGFSTLGPFGSSTPDDELGMCRLHQEVPLLLTRAALPAMLERGEGAVINVASIAAFLTLPGVATYAATKAFLASFSRSLRRELADSGVRVQCLCPGYTRTEIHSRESFAGFDVSRVPEAMWMEAGDVVRESLQALERDEHLVIPGDANRQLVQRALGALSEGLLA
jgi:short-subunit dehydrogenase